MAAVLALLAGGAPLSAQTSPPSGYVATLKWYHQRAEAGDPRAQFLLGIKYETGTDVERNLALAADWLERAARQGFADAQFKYATMLENGRGRPADNAAAETWYRAAALQNHAPAQFNLGVVLLDRARTEDSASEALAWLMRAAAQDLAPARELVTRMEAVHSDAVIKNARALAEIPLGTLPSAGEPGPRR